MVDVAASSNLGQTDMLANAASGAVISCPTPGSTTAALTHRDSRAYDGAKRALDLGASVAALVVLSPVLIAVAVAVKATSPGPVIFRQARYGLGGRHFQIWKFRTMTGAPRDAAAIGDARDHDARMSPIGHALRRYCIDELPQLVNVVAGDMSLVGPRAHPVGLHVNGALYESVVPHYHARHAVRPGMTGLAQAMGFVGIVDSEAHAHARVDHDILYVDVRSFALDVALIVWTAWRFLMRGGRGRRGFPIDWFAPADRTRRLRRAQSQS